MAVAALLTGCSATALTGGSPGSGGSPGGGGAGGAACDQLESAYALARTAAHACTPGAPNQCQALVPLAPSACPGDHPDDNEYVNDDAQVRAALAAWNAGCLAKGQICASGAGGSPPHGRPSSCVAGSSDASTGSCMPVVEIPDSGETCEQLSADYAAAMPAALSCTPGAPGQCQQLVVAQAVCVPNRCYDMVAVNEPSALTAVFVKWHDQRCDDGCRGLVCNGPLVASGVCVPVDGGSPTGGICMPPPPRSPPVPL